MPNKDTTVKVTIKVLGKELTRDEAMEVYRALGEGLGVSPAIPSIPLTMPHTPWLPTYIPSEPWCGLGTAYTTIIDASAMFGYGDLARQMHLNRSSPMSFGTTDALLGAH